ncbi:MAG TPA: DUF1622 domain-containing protein [Pyrinomonadaceae bacterium]|jgi:uncharacterized membrane protein
MEEIFKVFAGYAALGLEITAAVLITIGAVEAVIGLLRHSKRSPQKPFQNKKAVWLNLGVWLLLGLEFELGADIIRSAISPTWEQLGQLAAIAVIRTFLNYFLEKDIEKAAEPKAIAEELSPT